MTTDDEILAELKKIREAVEKAPPSTPPKGLWNEFKDFLSKYKVLGLAAAFVVALYMGALVLSVVKDFIMPLIGLAIPGLAELVNIRSNSHEAVIRHRRLLGCIHYLHNSCIHCLLDRENCETLEH